jgi:hypothetical protein
MAFSTALATLSASPPSHCIWSGATTGEGSPSAWPGAGGTDEAQLGVDACPMEGFDAAKYEEILGLTQLNLRASVVAAVGYRAADDWLAPMAKVRAKPEDLFIRH